eukprot:1186301-Pleurochrysis_carterae.AAC.1
MRSGGSNFISSARVDPAEHVAVVAQCAGDKALARDSVPFSCHGLKVVAFSRKFGALLIGAFATSVHIGSADCLRVQLIATFGYSMSEEATSFLILPAKCMHLCAQLHRRFQCISLRRQLLSIQDAAEVGDLRLADTSVLVTGWDTSTPGALSALILFLGPGSPGSLREKFGPGAVLGPFAQSQLPFLFIARPYFINDKTSPSMVSASVKEPAAAAALRSVEAASG